ncbi:MAG: peptide-methionine (R)-S-oxide reductase MsrB [Candidatus Sumerlaeaceae bacterium]|nr:peptide-methionine (R)-S-oxide reductase MsrB [Candidatus Sumerlaeaceae bacterium]
MIRKKWLLGMAAVLGLALPAGAKDAVTTTTDSMKGTTMTKPVEKITKTEDEWRKELSSEQFRLLRKHGTEQAFTGEYAHTKDKGMYKCAGCGLELFTSDTKFDSGTGWPSYYMPVAGAVETTTDTAYGMVRTEVHCARCGGHLGHVFDDGPAPTGQRYCINSVSLKLDKTK